MPDPKPLQVPPGHSPACQKKTLGCRELGSAFVTATSTSHKEVFLISAISSSENSLGMGEGG